MPATIGIAFFVVIVPGAKRSCDRVMKNSETADDHVVCARLALFDIHHVASHASLLGLGYLSNLSVIEYFIKRDVVE